jgi:tetratricopeptide (TPR) repeat protein
MLEKTIAVLATLALMLTSSAVLAQKPKSGAAPTQTPNIVATRALIEAGKYQEALTALNSIIEKEPNFGLAYAVRCQAKNRLGQIAESMGDCNRALQLQPRNTLALNIRGYNYFILKDNHRAFADLNAATEVDPSFAGPYSNRALIYSGMGEQDRALKELDTAIKLNPRFGPAYANLGAVHNKLQQYDKAIAAFDKAIPMVQGSAGNFIGRGVAHAGLGNYQPAMADFNEAIRINPKALGAYLNRGRVYLGMEKFDLALEDYNRVLGIEPRHVMALLMRAKALELSGELQKARADFEKVLEVLPAHGVASAGKERLDDKIAMASGERRPAANRAGVRTALVVGNSRYKVVDALTNPERDAKLVAGALQQSGFEKVNLLIDGTRSQLVEALKSFAQDARNADWAVVYFAGHGIEYGGSNYLVPVDVKFQTDADIPAESVALDQILNAVAGAGKLRLVILDACRENPFMNEMKQAGEGGAIGKGLARIEPESGTLVAFATKHGHLATDGGKGKNSPFATALVERIAVPGLEINQLFRLVHDDVLARTDKQQEPFTYGQLSAQGYYFKSR